MGEQTVRHNRLKLSHTVTAEGDDLYAFNHSRPRNLPDIYKDELKIILKLQLLVVSQEFLSAKVFF